MKGIRKRSNNHNGKANAMINNFWPFEYIIRSFKEKAEEYSIKVEEVSEYKTSSRCPRYHSEDITTNGRLSKCLNCELEANRDVVGVLNTSYLKGEGSVKGAVAHPLLLRWNGMRWEPKRAMNNQPMSTLEARIPLLK
ncbi:MAG: zinc ribbon domain-containing protein [Candidatus Bathyarchaeia archaeon]